MRNTAYNANGFGRGLGIDTLIVLFFLALEYGRGVQALSMDGLLMGVTMMMVLVLPFFLPSNMSRLTLGNWTLIRGGIALTGMALGVAFKQSIGIVVPESMRYMPMTFLILTSMVSCYIQFYALLKLRLAK